MEQQTVWTGVPRQEKMPKVRSLRNLWKRVWNHKALYLMALPGIIYYIVYRYIPIYGIVIAFKDFDISAGILRSPWADPWYSYFKEFYDSPYFSQLLANTILISLYKLLFGFFPPIILALLLFECRIRWFRSAIQTLTYLPHFLSWVVMYGILQAFLSPDGGIINRWLSVMGIRPIHFMASAEWFRSVLVGSEIWQGMGWGAIIYLAAMSSIDPTLYEAARVDGASRIQRILHITLPGIRFAIVLVLILRLGHVLDAGFEQIYMLYNIHVYPVADILDTWVFRVGLEEWNYSLASAVGFFKSVIGLVLVLLANNLAKKWGEGIW
ncbi:MAG: sugar transporter ATPase [Paenibacillaceae bacterium]|nr:sugar transporter ATPase [Paenibacillaceae bacterium]